MKGLSPHPINSKMGKLTQKWVKLLFPFTADYSTQFTETELARRSGIPQQSASRHLALLVQANIIRYSRKGKIKLFSLDLDRQTTRITLNLLEDQKALRFIMETPELTPLINHFMNHGESIIIFGSYASGNHDKESDIDVAIVGKYDKKAIHDIKENQVKEINEHYATYAEFERTLLSKNPLAIEIMNNHILFGNVSKIVDIFRKQSL